MPRALPPLLLILCASPGPCALIRAIEPAPAEGTPVVVALRREVTAFPTAGKVTIDGALTEPCWQGGLWIDDLVLNDGSGRGAVAQTAFKVRFDAQNLYLAVRASEPNMPYLKGFYGPTHDDQAFNDDCIEVWVDPDDLNRRAYHQVYSVVGGTYDQVQHEERCLDPSGVVRTSRHADRTWDAHGQAAFARSAAGWTCEMRLPVSDFGLDRIIPGSTWGFNLARERWAFPPGGRAEYSSLTGVFCWPLSAFAKLRLGVPEVQVTAFEFGTVGLGENRLRVNYRSEAGPLPAVDARLSVDGPERRSYRFSARPGAAEPQTVPYDLRSPGEYSLTFELLRPRSDEVLFRKQLTRRLDSVMLLRPRCHIAYLGADPWWVDVELLVGDVSLPRAQLQVALLSEAGRVIARQTADKLVRCFRVHLNLRRVRAEGDYLVRFTVADQGKELGAGSVPLRMVQRPR